MLWARVIVCIVYLLLIFLLFRLANYKEPCKQCGSPLFPGPLNTQEYKWVPANCQRTLQNVQKGLTCVDFYSTISWRYLCGSLSDHPLEVLELIIIFVSDCRFCGGFFPRNLAQFQY